MYSVEFQYTLHGGRKTPIIPIRIKSKTRWYEVWAFVDTGATYTIFEVKEAERLEIKHFFKIS